MRCNLIAALAAVTMISGAAAARAQTLTVGVSAPVTSIDPHYHTFTPNQQLDSNMFDRLVATDAHLRPIPGLALSWKLIDDTTWEFKLRTAKFQNGEDFTADDVAYTIARIPTVKNSPGSFTIYTKAITGTEVVDAHTIRFHTKGIYPLLPMDLSQIFIIPHSIGAAPATEDFNTGRFAIGTGPYRFVSYKPGDRVELARNDLYWGPKPAWAHVIWRIIPNDGARTASLLSGDTQLIDEVATEDLGRLRAEPKVKLWETTSLRVIFLTLDQSREGPTPFVTGPNGEILPHNPLKDRRVREALSIAINRPLLVDRVMENAAIATGQFLPPGSYSYVPDLPPPAYDPAKAKALLAEAGYPNGLTITLHSPNDRYLNDAKIVQAVGQMWARIGIKAHVEPVPWSSFIGHANKQDYSVYLLGWGISSGEASNPLRGLVGTWDPAKGRGSVNRGRYSNPEVDALTDKALATADDAAREKILIQAERLVFQDTALIPLHIQKNNWASRAGFTYVPRADEETRADDLRPTP
jgi:peptide/nickel transport system substrate-binding protein